MKKSILGLVAVGALIAGPAMAADLRMPVKAPAPAPVAMASWTGCYIDGGIGYGMYNQDSFSQVGGVQFGTKVTNGGRGWLGRLGAGCDYQIASSWVIGVFGDYDFMDLHGNFGDPSGPVVGNEKERDAWYVGGRLGYLVTPSLLTYFDGGYTQTRFDAINFVSATVPSVALGLNVPAHTYSGWFVGGGTEYALSGIIPIQGLFWRTEYRFAQYQSANLPVVVSATGVQATIGGLGVSQHMEKSTQTVTSGLVWRFNFGGPIGARY
jgi:outer membrane immunogenic protein